MIGLVLALAASAPHAPCFATARDVAAGAMVRAEDLTQAPCTKAAVRSLRYDRINRVAIFARDLPAGSYLGPVTAPTGGYVAKGAALTLRSTSGPVIVERAVTAMQPGRAGGRLFVRDDRGNVFSAPLALEEGE